MILSFMNRHHILLICCLLFLGAGCSNSSILAMLNGTPATTAVEPAPVVNEVTGETVREAFARNLQAQAPLEYAPQQQIANLPDHVFPEQVGDAFSFGDLLFVIILRPSPMVAVDLPPEQIKQAGVLVSLNQGASWETFYFISLERYRVVGSAHKTIQWNVVGLFIKDGTMYIDTADERHNLIRNKVSATDLGASFRREDCYTFSVTDYYKFTPDGRPQIHPDSLAPATTCDWGKFPQYSQALDEQ